MEANSTFFFKKNWVGPNDYDDIGVAMSIVGCNHCAVGEQLIPHSARGGDRGSYLGGRGAQAL